MSTQEVANRLVELCRAGDYETCYKELYAENAWSIEPESAPTPPVQGMAAFKEKGKKWNEMMKEFHGSSIGDPICGDKFFSCTMSTDITFKGRGRVKMNEICVYEVEDGKIVKEQFFY